MGWLRISHGSMRANKHLFSSFFIIILTDSWAGMQLTILFPCEIFIFTYFVVVQLIDIHNKYLGRKKIEHITGFLFPLKGALHYNIS